MIGSLRDAFRKRKKLFAGWTSLGHPSITEIFSMSGVDFIGIDMEHSTISLAEAQQIIATAHSKNVACLPRISTHNEEQIKRLLDSGADGLIVPMVNTVEEVKQIIRWYKYFPVGKRSYGIARAQDYGFGFSKYTSTWNKRSSLIIQIESVTGVQNVEKLLSETEVDGVMIGPYDLSGTLGIPGQLQHPKVVEACRHVIEACKKRGVSCGTQLVQPDKESINKALKQGYTFIVLSSDVFLLWKWSENIQHLIKSA